MEYSIQTSLFVRQVKDFLSPLPPLVTENTTCLEVAQLMRQTTNPQVLVSNSDGRLIGIINSWDLHQVTFATDVTVPVQLLMTQPVHTASEDLPLYQAIADIRRHNLCYLPVVNQQYHPIGMLYTENILMLLLGEQLTLADSIANDHTFDDLFRAKQTQADLAAVLLAQHVPATEILTVLSKLNDEIYHRIMEQSIQELQMQGLGTPPVAFAVIITGSGGRFESLLNPDQDNGFILEDYPDELYPQVNDYFYELANHMTIRLDQAGIPFCKGHMMASNHAWRKRLSEWQSQFLGWLRKPALASTTLLDIWIDFRCVFGSPQLAETLRHFTTTAIPPHFGFLRELEFQQFDHDIAITPFRTLKREHLPGQEGHRKVDIKRKGLRPLMEGVRLLALREGLTTTETLTRLSILRERGVLNPDLADGVANAFGFLNELLLRTQLQDFRAGRTPGAYLEPKLLSTRNFKHLKEALRTVTRLQGMIHMEFTAELF